MANPIRFDPTDEEPALTFYCGQLPVEDAVIEAGHEPNGYFWEGVVGYLDPKLAGSIEFDSESGMFCAYGRAEALHTLENLLEPYLDDPEEITRLLRQAEEEGFEFDD